MDYDILNIVWRGSSMEELEYKLQMLHKIMDVTNKLDSNLNEMRKLELEGHKDSSLYHSYFLKYVVMKEVENDYYRKLNLDVDTYMMLSDLIGIDNMMGSCEDIIYTWQGEYITAPSVRIMKRLKEEVIKNYGRFDYSVPTEDYELYNEYLKEKGVSLADFIAINEKFYDNVAIAYTYFLDEGARKETDPKKREMYINAKYNMIMINKEAEKGLLLENMDIEYLDKEQEALIMDVPKNIYTQVVNILCEQGIGGTILGIKKDSLHAIDNCLVYPLIRSYLVNMSNMAYRIAEFDKAKIMDGNISMKKLRDIDDVIKSGKEDRKKVKVIKFA